MFGNHTFSKKTGIEIYKNVKAKLRLGASNNILNPVLDSKSIKLFQTTLALRKIWEFFKEEKQRHRICAFSEAKDEANNMGILLDMFILALLAEIVETGMCAEYAVVTLVELLESRSIKNSIEYVGVYGMCDGSISAHTVLVEDRPIQSKIKVPTTWGSVKLYNLWCSTDSEPKRFESGLVEKELLHPADSARTTITTIQAEFRLEENLNPKQWKYIADSLEKMGDILFKNITKYSAPLTQAGFTVMETKAFLEKFRSLINRKTSLYRKYAMNLEMLISHWNKSPSYSATEFKVRSAPISPSPDPITFLANRIGHRSTR